MICMIDDDEIFHLTTVKKLQHAGFEEQILSFKRGYAAIEFLKKQSSLEDDLPKFILLDINMPEIDGWELLEQLQAIPSFRVPVYMVSSSVDERDKRRAELTPLVRGFFSKPLDVQKVMALL